MRNCSVGIVAVGTIGKMYGRLLCDYFPDTRIRLIIDKYQTVEQLREVGIETERVCKDLNELLNCQEIDRVIVASSTPSHVEICRQLIHAGKHILCEKPISFKSRQILALGKEAEKKKVILRVGYMRRHDPDYKELKRRISAGEIGKLYSVKIVSRDPKRPSASYSKKAGSIFTDFMIHDFDMIRYLTGQEVIKIYAEANLVPVVDIDNSEYADTALVTLRLADNSLAVVDCARESNYGYDQRIEVFGTGGCLKAENLSDFQLTKYSDTCSSYLPKYDYQIRYKNAFIEEIKDFYRAVEGKPSIIAGYEDDAQAIDIAEQCDLSLKEEQPIRFKNFPK